MKRSTMYVFGGGHDDYWGNEVYCIDVSSGTVARCWGPGAWESSNSVSSLSDGTPTSRHTYGNVLYLPPPFDVFFSSGGAVSPGGFGPAGTWTATLPFSSNVNPWTERNLAPNYFEGPLGGMLAYDPVTRRVYTGGSWWWNWWDPATAMHGSLGEVRTHQGYHLSSAIDPVRRKIFVAGSDAWPARAAISMFMLAESVSVPGRQGEQAPLDVTGCTETPAVTSVLSAGSPGIGFVPSLDRLVLWSGGSAVYSVHPDTGACVRLDQGRGPDFVAIWQGTFGRWAYDPNHGVMVIQNRTGEEPWVFRVHL